MAVFNPEIKPTNDPTYGSNSRAIDTPNPIPVQGVDQNRIMPKGQEIGDRSAEFEGQAAAFRTQAESLKDKQYGDLFANVVGIGDFLGKAGVAMVKKDIETRVYEVADRERQKYTAELEQLKVGKNILDSNASMDDEPVPEEIEGLPERLETLRSAKDGGKLTKTDYQGRLLAEAKTLRAQYPGFKKEIDAEFAAVTGQNPANARINGLITEINRNASAAASKQNKMLTYIRGAANSGVPGADKLYAQYEAGLVSDAQAVSQISQYTQAKEKMVYRAAQMNDKNLSRTEVHLRAKTDGEYALGVAVAGVADTLMSELGITTKEQATELAAAEKNGAIPKVKWDELNVKTANAMSKLRVEMLRELDKNGFTRNLKDGKNEAIQMVNAALEPLKTIQERIISKDFGGMHEAANESKLILDQAKTALLKDSKAGPMWQTMNVIREIGGEQYMQSYTMREAFKKNGVADSFADWAKRWDGEFEAQRKKKLGGETVTYMDLVNEMKTKGIAANDPKQQQAILGTLVEKVSKIGQANVPDDIKANIIHSAFSPENNEFLSKLNMDSIDRNNKPVKGMNAVFQKWTAPEVTQEIARLSKKDPELWTKYENWVSHTFGNTLVKREINDLKDIANPNIKVGWNTETKRFETRFMDVESGERARPGLTAGGASLPGMARTDTEYGMVQRSVNRLNSNISNLKVVAESNGMNVDAYVMRTIADAAGPDVLRNVSGLPYQIIRNMALGTIPKKQ